MSERVLWVITGQDNTTVKGLEIENNGWTGWSVALHIFLSLAGLTLFWRRKDILSKMLMQLDRRCISVFCPSFSQREKLLKWAGNRLPSTWSSQSKTLGSGILELWRDGSLLCTLINTVVPGACPNPHRHWKKTPAHGLALAYKYLGVPPMFTEFELSSDFTPNYERHFIHYLNELQKAINKMSSNEDGSSHQKYSAQYVARGMGLYTGEQHKKAVFYIYSNLAGGMTHQRNRRANILMYIRGPYGTQGKATITPFHRLKTTPAFNMFEEAVKMFPKASQQSEKQKTTKSFLKTISLDLSSLISSQNKTQDDDIPIQVTMEIDRLRISYIPNHHGMYEINLIGDGELLTGSPFSVHIFKGSSQSKDTFDIGCAKSEDKVILRRRKIISKTIDCVDEHILIDDDQVTKMPVETVKNCKNIFKKGALPVAPLSEQNVNKRDLIVTTIKQNNDEIIKTEIKCTVEPITEQLKKNLKSELVQLNPCVNFQIGNETVKNDMSIIIEEKENSCIADSDGTSIEKALNFLNSTLTGNLLVAQKPTEEVGESQNSTPPDLMQESSPNSRTIDENTNNHVHLIPEPDEKEVSSITSNYDENSTEMSSNSLSSSSGDVLMSLNPAERARELQNCSSSSTDSIERTKDLKNMINATSKEEMMTNKESSKLKRLTSKMYIELSSQPPRQTKLEYVENPSLDAPSPICPAHIVPEVVRKNSFQELTVAEKRRIFSQQKCLRSSSYGSSAKGEGSSFSDETAESVEIFQQLAKTSPRKSGELSVLTVLNSIKKSLSNSASLPDMTSIDEYSQYSVKSRKDFWERLSSRSSSSANLSSSSFNKSKKIEISERNIFDEKLADGTQKEMNKYNEINLRKKTLDSTRSLDDSLEDCCRVSIKERKKILLKEQFEKEQIGSKAKMAKEHAAQNTGGENNKNTKKIAAKTQHSSMTHEDQKTSPTNTRRNNETTEYQSEESTANKTIEGKIANPTKTTNNNSKRSPLESIKSPFKRAIKYFKNLEEISKKSKIEKAPTKVIKTSIDRRYSLDFGPKNNSHKQYGGSLNLPRTSERFSIGHLYEDILGNKRRGSFKGTPNTQAVAITLASLSKNFDSQNRFLKEDENTENIKYNMFVGKGGAKKRKSIKMLFDVNY